MKNLKIIQIEGQKNLILVKGHVPGHNGGYVMIRRSHKTTKPVEHGEVQA